MKIYFIASPRGVNEFGHFYKKTYQILKDLGHTLVDDLIVKIDVKKFYEYSHKERAEHYKKVMKAIRDCDVAVVEITVQSMTMGYIVDKALEQGKPVIVLHLEDFDPFFFSGMQDEKLQVCGYNEQNLKDILKQALDIAQETMDTRFTLLFTPKIITFLDQVYKEDKIPRSVYIRKLIEVDMKKRGK